MRWWRKIFRRRKKSEAPLSVVPKERGRGLRRAAMMAQQKMESRQFPIRVPELVPGIVPKGERPAIATDSTFGNLASSYANSYDYGLANGFPGYPYLAALATRPEYRAMAENLAKSMTREWIAINSSDTAGDATKNKVTELTKKLDDIDLRAVIRTAVEHDAYYGRAQVLIELRENGDRSLPLILSPATVPKGSFLRVKNVEPMWTTPVAYNSIDPGAADFYKPSEWYMLGQKVHASRLLTVITRPVSDMLKPAFNFGGMSLSQLAEPYVDNWLRTRQSVSDLINNFSITALKTSMDQVLSGEDDGGDLFERAELFTATRSNRGLMLLDKEREDLAQINVPLSGLHELQAQSQEHMCSVSHLPAIILTGISPSGLNASSEGEVRVFYDWIAGEQEGNGWRKIISTILAVLQLSMYGEIDPDIQFAFVSLYQMTPRELAEIRTADATTAATYIDRGVIAADEQRERLARDPESGYQGLDISREIESDEDKNNDDE